MDEFLIVGRDEKVTKEHGLKYLMHIGYVNGKKLLVDCLLSHAIFICGMRGTGKSYTLGVFVEELLLNNPRVACVVIDPVGVFWAMKEPNRDDIELLASHNLLPRGFSNVEVFIPYGFKGKIPKESYDSTFSLSLHEVSVDDWCHIFNFKRFSPQALLLEKAIAELKENFSVDELIEKVQEIGEREKFKRASIHAVVSKLSAVKEWGVFEKNGNEIKDFCKEGRASVIDVSLLGEDIYCLVTSIIAKKILQVRKRIARVESGGGVIEESEYIPPTWLIVDEAHTLAPHHYKTPASKPLIEYVKQGRRPGCSIVMATQQPHAVDQEILSQMDIVIAHRLGYESDITAVIKRMPCRFSFDKDVLRDLKTGEAVLGDRFALKNTIRIKVRPRLSRHEGRDILCTKSELKIVKKGKEEKVRKERYVVGIKGDVERAIKIAERVRRKKFLFFGDEEIISRVERILTPVWKVTVSREIGRGAREIVDVLIDDKTGRVVNFFAGRIEPVTLERLEEGKAKRKAKMSRRKVEEIASAFGEVEEVSTVYREIFRITLKDSKGRKRVIEVDELAS